MLSQIASEKTLPIQSGAQDPARHPRPRLVALPTRPKILAELNRRECRYCVADTAEGQMHLALFCAAPVDEGAYCTAHRRACRLPGAIDPEALAAEIEAAIAPPR
jgi:hypothetical protein